jgi:hypothetical protein
MWFGSDAVSDRRTKTAVRAPGSLGLHASRHSSQTGRSLRGMSTPSEIQADQADDSYALSQAEKARAWYQRNREASRVRFQISEVALLMISAGVPISGVLTPHDARLPTAIGALVVALTGLRPVFHWRDNWIRSAITASVVDAEIRLYLVHAPPYDRTDRASRLLRRLNEVEGAEYATWAQLSGPAKTEGGDGREAATDVRHQEQSDSQ